MELSLKMVLTWACGEVGLLLWLRNCFILWFRLRGCVLMNFFICIHATELKRVSLSNE